jgi:HAD superfamily hydrolase (TIGR01450 family)
MPPAYPALSAADACARYEAIRPRLPAAAFPPAFRTARDLSEIAGEIDAFVLDGFGVLNVGEAPVPGAAARVAALQAAGKTVLVLTNGATHPVAAPVAKYAKFGMNFAPSDVVSSRDALADALAARSDGLLWGFAAMPDSEIGALAPGAVLLGDDPADYGRVSGFVLLSANAWGPARQALLRAALAARPRPLLVGNPDLVAPREDGLSLEPGFHAHALWDETGVAPAFYGKPFPEAFRLAAARLPKGIDPRRVAMVGDTLHTDILGGAAQGWRTVLVKRHGLLRDLDHAALIRETGIVPDWVAETT